MYIANITDDYNDTITINNNCTNNDNNIVLEITPLLTLITIVPCGVSLKCLISFMAYTLTKTFFKK